jgi:hypothetical protein
MNILDQYWKKTPSPQQVVDIFRGEWSSKLPDIEGVTIASGHADLFHDQRIMLLNEYFPLHGKKVLELGPLEAAHTYMMHRMGAQITAVEANQRAYLKCLIVKELYHLHQASFLGGDALEYMKQCKTHYDLCVASGILYHGINPPLFIEWCCHVADRVFVWTHYYDEQKMSLYPSLYDRFESIENFDYSGRSFPVWKFHYKHSLDWEGFCGGQNPYSIWLRKEDIIEIFIMQGFRQIHVFFDDLTHPLGPNICFIAEKK